MKEFCFKERRLMISYSSKKDNAIIPKKIFLNRINLIKTLKTYIKKYYNYAANKNNILYLSILYLDIILSKDKLNLSSDKNLKFLCLCCFMLSLKFLGDYDLSKKIIRNFCQNYKEEYRVFEIQCLQLLDYNLIYATSYDYLTMILNHDQKKLLNICNSFLYKICESDLYLYYSPFYIAISIIQLGKNFLNDKSYNYHDKYFKDQRVIYLFKAFNKRFNVINFSKKLNLEDNNNNDINNKINFEKKNYINIYKNKSNSTISNINIFTNNTIQNNIVIINEFNKENTNITNINDNNFSSNTYLRTLNSNSNINPLKIIVNRYNNNINNNKINYIKVDKKRNNCFYKCEHNTERITRLRQNKSKNGSNFRYRNSFNNVFNYVSNRSKNKKENSKTQDKNKKTIENQNFRNHIKSNTNIYEKPIYANKSSLNFKLLSNVPKEVLFKLSKHISKTFKTPLDKIPINKFDNLK